MDVVPTKFNIEKDAQELKLYIFTIQTGPVAIEVPEDIRMILAYNDHEATNEALRGYTLDKSFSVRKRAQVEIKQLIGKVDLPPTIPQEVKIVMPEPPTKEKTKNDFINGLMLVADKFVVEQKDRTALKKIITKLQINATSNF